ncbi:MAG: AraC family transcriptional regulator N-terminal domain-containing protein [Psychroflexus sp.]|nr:AraC family transcriptional regulator N-terminal domain-containing protein [Psychroflexus sp.]MDR9449093.1 AraC family transcriptional regulator N-terminal domain-containing protein [Psychroflexus sp.]
MSYLFQSFQPSKIETLVENKNVYSSEFSELYVYETFQKAKNVYLQFDFPIIASMLQGKKHMYVGSKPSFDFIPGETVTLPSNEKMIIDFPEAKIDEPTRCLALGIDINKIKNTTEQYMDMIDIRDDNKLSVDVSLNPQHLKNNDHIKHLINKLMITFIQDNKSKNALIDIMINELIIRLLQTKAKHIILSEGKMDINKNRLAYITKYIEDNITEDLSVESLANKAYMSTSNFYRKFKDTFGETPIDYLNTKRIEKAKQLLRITNEQITHIAHLCGYNSSCYFTRIFKNKTGMTPNQYRKKLAFY